MWWSFTISVWHKRLGTPKPAHVPLHAGRGLSLNTAVRSSGRGVSPAVDSPDELENLRPRTARSSNTGRRRLVTKREQLSQDPNQQDEAPQPKPRKPNVLSVPRGPLDIRHILETDFNAKQLPAAVWDQTRSQMAKWTGLRKDWSQCPEDWQRCLCTEVVESCRNDQTQQRTRLSVLRAA